MKCQNCNNTNFYILANDYIKCKKCAKKYSLKKIEKDKQVAISFSQNKNALETSKELQLNYKTVKDRFDIYRKEIMGIPFNSPIKLLRRATEKEISDYNSFVGDK